VDGRFWGLESNGTSYLLQNTSLSPFSFGIDHQGEVYMLASNGRIYRFSATGGSLGFESFIEPIQFLRNIPILETFLPSARGGSGSFTYSVVPSLPSGLSFDSKNQSLTGTPSEGLNSTIFTLIAEDGNGLRGSMEFELSVLDPTHIEASDEALGGFILHGHYQTSEYTYIRFDLGESAIIAVDVYDLIGRQVMNVYPRFMEAASQQTIGIPTYSLPSGTYLYRVILEADSRINAVSKLLIIK